MNPIYLKSFIERAMIDKSYLKIDYVDSKMKITKDRIIEPMAFKKTNGEIDRIVAQDLHKNDLRTFQFEGIQKIAVAEMKDL